MDDKQKLLEKFSRRECSPEEVRLLFKYLNEGSASDYEQVMDEVWQEVQNTSALEASLSEAMYGEIQHRIQADKPSGLSGNQGRQVFLFNFRGAMAKTAAACAAVLLSGWLLYMLVHRTEQMHETTFGTTATIQLPDMSVVTLNGNSRIRYDKKWDDSKVREVWLEGEAFFSVTHTADHRKFVVHTNNMSIEVLGTEFNVNNRRGATKVTLSSGLVRLNGKGTAKVKDVVMHPGEQASLNNQQEFQMKQVDVRKFLTWKDNVMTFDDTPVLEVAILIEETYGLEVVLDGDSLQDLKLTGSLPANDVAALLGMLRETLELDVTRNNDQVIIRRKSNE